MKYPVMGLAALVVGALLPGCGGGGDSASFTPSPPAAASTKVSLAAGNYQDAATRAMAASNTTYAYARLAIRVVDDLLNVPLGTLPIFSCSGGGLLSIELTDQNKDTSLDPGDTAHLTWDHCRQQGLTTTGVVRVELTDATQIPGGRDYQIVITVANLEMISDTAGVPTITANLIAPVHYTRSATTDHTVIGGAAFTAGLIPGDTGKATLYLDYLQDGAAQTYSFSAHGTVDSSALGGFFDFTTPVALTGVIGEYPSAGNVSITGNANSVVRLAEEGAAAADPATVQVTVDANGDGALDASNSLAWSSVVPSQLFDAFVGQSGLVVPIP
jgi:hypothetical protein